MSIIKQEYGSFTDVETQQMLAPILYSLIANRDFAVGDLFIFQNKLYKAIKAISTTDPIVIGDGTDPSDNATAASTVSEELMQGGLRYKVIATASANKTYAQQLAILKTTWDTLTEDEKKRCALCFNYSIYSGFNYGTTAGRFIFMYAGGSPIKSYIRVLDIVNYLYFSGEVTGTIVDASTQTNSYDMTLELLTTD